MLEQRQRYWLQQRGIRCVHLQAAASQPQQSRQRVRINESVLATATLTTLPCFIHKMRGKKKSFQFSVLLLSIYSVNNKLIFYVLSLSISLLPPPSLLHSSVSLLPPRCIMCRNRWRTSAGEFPKVQWEVFLVALDVRSL